MGFFKNVNAEIDYKKECVKLLDRINDQYVIDSPFSNYWDWLRCKRYSNYDNCICGGYRKFFMKRILASDGPFGCIYRYRVWYGNTPILEILYDEHDDVYRVDEDKLNIYNDDCIQGLYYLLCKWYNWIEDNYKKDFMYKVYSFGLFMKDWKSNLMKRWILR